jgi:hypothetical protein
MRRCWIGFLVSFVSGNNDYFNSPRLTIKRYIINSCDKICAIDLNEDDVRGIWS